MSGKKLPVDLDQLAEAMDQFERDTHEWFLDTQGGEVILIGREFLRMAEGEDEEDEENLPEWQKKSLAEARQIVEDATDRYRRVPECERHRAWQLMADFTAQVPDPRLRERLERAIAGKGAFRRFKDQLFDDPAVRQRWFAFERDGKRQWAIDWLEELAIESTWEPLETRAQTPADWIPSVVGVHHVQITIPPGAEDKARQFYCEVLGLPEISKPESLQGRRVMGPGRRPADPHWNRERPASFRKGAHRVSGHRPEQVARPASQERRRSARFGSDPGICPLRIPRPVRESRRVHSAAIGAAHFVARATSPWAMGGRFLVVVRCGKPHAAENKLRISPGAGYP